MLKDIRDFYFKWQVWEIKTTKPRKNVVIKHIDSSMPKERYQPDTVLLSNYVTLDGYKYLFTIGDYFTKKYWIETLKEKTAIIILRAFKRWIRAHNIPTILR